MDLKNRRIALHIDDPELRYQLSELLMKNGAVVHGARDEVELQRVVDRLGVEIVVVDRMAIEIVLAAVKPVSIGLN
jgi:DNA-binding response OmpR family regulator